MPPHGRVVRGRRRDRGGARAGERCSGPLVPRRPCTSTCWTSSRELSRSFGLIAAIAACNRQFAWTNATGSVVRTAASIAVMWSLRPEMSAGEACHRASSISKGSRASRMRMALATSPCFASRARTEFPSRTIGDRSALNRPPPGPGLTVISPRDCTLKVPTDTPHWLRNSSLVPSRALGSTALTSAATCSATPAARPAEGTRGGYYRAAGSPARARARYQSPGRSAGQNRFGRGPAVVCPVRCPVWSSSPLPRFVIFIMKVIAATLDVTGYADATSR